MAEHRIQLQDIHNNAKVSWATVSKINKDEVINFQSLVKTSNYIEHISGKATTIYDILDIIDIE